MRRARPTASADGRPYADDTAFFRHGVFIVSPHHAQIQAIHRHSRGTYGVPRVHAELAADGVPSFMRRMPANWSNLSPAERREFKRRLQ